jgi:hypothetical protein
LGELAINNANPIPGLDQNEPQYWTLGLDQSPTHLIDSRLLNMLFVIPSSSFLYSCVFVV